MRRFIDAFTSFFRKPPADRIIVHLGNLGADEGEKTRKYAKRFIQAGFLFIGVDVRESALNKPHNWVQFQEDFIWGLRKLPNNSVDIVSSELALGHYGWEVKGKTKMLRQEYTIAVIKLVKKKLKKGGKLMVVTGDINAQKYVAAGIIAAGLKLLKKKKVDDKEVYRTWYMAKYHEKPRAHLSSGMTQFIAQKD